MPQGPISVWERATLYSSVLSLFVYSPLCVCVPTSQLQTFCRHLQHKPFNTRAIIYSSPNSAAPSIHAQMRTRTQCFQHSGHWSDAHWGAAVWPLHCECLYCPKHRHTWFLNTKEVLCLCHRITAFEFGARTIKFSVLCFQSPLLVLALTEHVTARTHVQVTIFLIARYNWNQSFDALVSNRRHGSTKEIEFSHRWTASKF